MTTTETVKEKSVSVANKIRAYKLNNPKAQPKDIAAALGLKVARVYAVNFYDTQKKKTKKKNWKTVMVSTSAKAAMPFKNEAERIYEMTKGRQRMHPVTGKLLMQAAPDNVNHPAHYKVGGIETIDFIEAKQLNYNLGNVVKYITRADHKGNNIEDLQKARWYLNREISKLNK